MEGEEGKQTVYSHLVIESVIPAEAVQTEAMSSVRPEDASPVWGDTGFRAHDGLR